MAYGLNATIDPEMRNEIFGEYSFAIFINAKMASKNSTLPVMTRATEGEALLRNANAFASNGKNGKKAQLAASILGCACGSAS